MNREARTTPEAWRVLIDEYRQDGASKVSIATLDVRVIRVERFAYDVRVHPGDVTREMFDRWIGTLRCAPKTTQMYVGALRSFYDWALRHGRLFNDPVPRATAPGRKYEPDQKWLDGIGAFERAQFVAGIAPGTLRRRLQHVTRFAASTSVSPWLVTAEDFQLWMSAESGSASSRAAVRDSLRAFFRWAVAAGRMKVDPSIEPSGRYRKLGVPEAWDAPLRQFRTFLIARGMSPQSVRSYLDLMGNFARELSSMGPFDATMDDIFEWMAGKTWARETLRMRRNVLRSFYRWATTSGRMAVDPTENLPVVRAGDLLAQPATDDQYEVALREARVHGDERWELALRMGCEMGLRRAEAAQAHASDISVDRDGSHWLRVHGKGGKMRHVPIPDALLPMVQRRGNGYLLPSSAGGHVTPRYLGKRVSALLPEGVTMHALRHAFATRVYNVSNDTFAVQQLLGHSSAATTQRYVHVSREKLRDLVNTQRPPQARFTVSEA